MNIALGGGHVWHSGRKLIEQRLNKVELIEPPTMYELWAYILIIHSLYPAALDTGNVRTPLPEARSQR
jgi:hypothetical protein